MARSDRSEHTAQLSGYWLHLGAYAAPNVVITHSPLTLRAGLPFALTFVAAMAVHFT